TPSRLPPADQRRVADVLAAAARALGLQTGPVHAELRWSRSEETPASDRVGERGLRPREPVAGGTGPFEGPVLIEMAARPIGGLCSRSLRFESGLSLEDLVVRHALGAEQIPARVGGASGVMMIPTPARVPSALRAVDGVEAARAIAGVNDVMISVRIGETLMPLPEKQNYTDFVFAAADTPESVEQALRAAVSQLRFTVAP